MSCLTFLAMAALVATVAAAAGSVSRLTINPVTKVVREGQDTELHFTLTKPIHCPEAYLHDCKVLLLLTNTRTDEIALSACHVEWDYSEWETTKIVHVRGVEDFVDDGQKEFLIITEPLISHSLFYNQVDPQDFVITTQNRKPAQCSSITDPNYNTFDGERYTDNTAGTVLFWASDHRDWEVQTRVSNALNCGVAIKDGCDLVVFDQCSGKGLSVYKSFKNAPEDKLQIVHHSNTNTYVIKSRRSAAEVKIVLVVRINVKNTRHCGWSGCRTVTTSSRQDWLDITGTAPGDDFGVEDASGVARTRGACGSYDGVRGNDVKRASSWLVSRPLDMFITKGTNCKGDITPPTNPVRCPKPPAPKQRPLIVHPDIEDLTDIIKVIRPSDDDQRSFYEFDATFFEDEVPEDAITAEERLRLREYCETAMSDSIAGAKCAEFINLEPHVESCVQDMQLKRNDATREDLVDGAVASLQEQCLFVLGADLGLFTGTKDSDQGLLPGPVQVEVAHLVCENDCTFNGDCVRGKCQCYEDWSGSDCTVPKGMAPPVMSLSPHKCDSTALASCDTVISVSTQLVVATPQLACRINGVRTPAVFLGSVEVQCQLPSNMTHVGANEMHLDVELSTDGEFFGDTLPYTLYDAKCKECPEIGSCQLKAGTCAVDGVCYHDGEVSPANPCRACQPAKGGDSFFPLYAGEQCAPAFDQKAYVKALPEDTAVGATVLTVSAGNQYVAGDEEQFYTMSLSAEADGLFTIENTAQSGVAVVKTAGTFDYENGAHQYEMTVTVTGRAGGLSQTAKLTINILDINEEPVLGAEQYDATLLENAAAQDLFVATATDADLGKSDLGSTFATLSFSLESFPTTAAAKLFTVDPVSGVVSSTGPVDYEKRDVYKFVVRVTDGGGSFATAPVTITVENVNEAPTSLSLSANEIAENADAGTIVGVMSTADPDVADTHTYRIVTGDDTGLFGFKAEGEDTVLYIKAPLNYEEHPKKFVLDIESRDAAGNRIVLDFEVRVLDRNDPPTAIHLYTPEVFTDGEFKKGDTPLDPDRPRTALTQLPEDSPLGEVLGEFQVTDEDASDMHTIEIVDPDNTSPFAVSGRFLVLRHSLDFETSATVTLVVTAKDNGEPQLHTGDITFTIAVGDTEDKPKGIKLVGGAGEDGGLVVDETVKSGDIIGTVEATDDDAGQNMAFTVGDKCPFTVGKVVCKAVAPKGTHCEAPLTLTRQLSLSDASSSVSCDVTAVSDADGAATRQTVTVRITSLEVELSPDTVAEKAAAGTVVGSFVAKDEKRGKTFTYRLKNAADVPVKIEGNEVVVDGEVVFNAAVPLALEVEVLEGGVVVATFTENVFVSDTPITVVMDADAVSEHVNDATTPNGRAVGTISLRGFDRPGQTPVFRLEGDAAAVFSLVPAGNTATLVVSDSKALDYETGAAVIDVIVVVAFTGPADTRPPTFSHTFRVSLLAVDEAPVFAADTATALQMTTDDEVGKVLTTLRAVDPEGGATPVVYTIVSGNDLGLFRLDSATGELKLRVSPRVSSIPLGQTFVVVVQASDGDQASTVSLSYTVELGSKPITTTTGVPLDSVADAAQSGDGNAGAASGPVNAGASVGLIAGIVIPLIALILLVILAVVVIRRRNRDNTIAALQKDMDNAQHNPMFREVYSVPPPQPAYEAMATSAPPQSDALAFIAGVENPMYAWYQPRMTAADAYASLEAQDLGAFVVRDNAPTPQWHILHVKTGPNNIHDEKIDIDPNGTYSMVSTSPQPTFDTVPELVKYYASPDQRGLSVALVVGDMIYDNAALSGPRGAANGAAPARAMASDGPALPLKQRDVSAVQIVAAGAGSDLYLNQAEAASALHSRA